MANKKLEVGDIVKVKKGEGVNVSFQGKVNKLYENAVLLEVDEMASPNPIALLNLPNNFLVVRQSLCKVIGHENPAVVTKKNKDKKATSKKNSDSTDKESTKKEN